MDLTRLALIRQLRERMIMLPAADIDLLLMGLDEPPLDPSDWNGGWDYSPDDDDHRRLITERLKSLPSAQLAELAEAIRTLIDSADGGVRTRFRMRVWGVCGSR